MHDMAGSFSLRAAGLRAQLPSQCLANTALHSCVLVDEACGTALHSCLLVDEACGALLRVLIFEEVEAKLDLKKE